MANKTTTTLTAEQKHEILDIEISVDKDISERIQAEKDAYLDAIAGYKESKIEAIAGIRRERKQLIADAVAAVMEA